MNKYEILNKDGNLTVEDFNYLKEQVDDLRLKLDKEISNRENLEKAIELNASNFLSIINNSGESVLVHTDGQIVFINDRLTKISGYSKKEILKNDIKNFIPEKYREFVIGKLLEANENGQTSFEVELSTKDGKNLFVMVRTLPILFEDKPSQLITLTDITLQRNFEDILIADEEKYRNLFENSLDGIFQCDTYGSFLMVNNKFAKIFGFKNSEDFIENVNNVKDFVLTKRDWQQLYKTVLRKSDLIPEFEFEAKKNNGEKIWIIVNARKIYHQNKLSYIEGTVSDISDRKYIEEVLRESENRFRALIENVSDLISLVESNGRVRFESPSVTRLLGLAMLGNNFRDYIIDKDQILYDDALAKLMKEDRSYFTVELRIENSKKEIRTFECVLQNLIKDPYVEGIVINSRDVTERKLIEDELEFRVKNRTKQLQEANSALEKEVLVRKVAEEQIRKFSHALMQSQNSLSILDKDLCFEYVNPKFTQDTGFTYDEVVGSKPYLIQNCLSNTNDIIETINISGVWKVEYLNKRKDKSDFWEAVIISAIKNEEGVTTHYLMIGTDISERIKFENEIIKAKESAEKADELKSAFLTQVSHEIRQPVNVILNYSSLINYELEELQRSDLSELFSSIEKASNRLVRSIDLIITMSQIQTGNYKPKIKQINITEIFEKIASHYLKEIETKHLEFIFIKADDDLILNADEYTLNQILSNLLDNAVKYTKFGKIEVRIFSQANFIFFEIEDTGIGISEEFIKKLFIPFIQEEIGYTRKYDGNGLGLALVKKCIEINNGEISVQSKKGKGSVFTAKFNKA